MKTWTDAPDMAEMDTMIDSMQKTGMLWASSVFEDIEVAASVDSVWKEKDSDIKSLLFQIATLEVVKAAHITRAAPKDGITVRGNLIKLAEALCTFDAAIASLRVIDRACRSGDACPRCPTGHATNFERCIGPDQRRVLQNTAVQIVPRGKQQVLADQPSQASAQCVGSLSHTSLLRVG